MNIICYIFLYVCRSNNDVRSIINLKYYTNPINGGTSHNLPNLMGFFIFYNQIY